MKYNPALDGLRAVAAILVVAHHCRVPGLISGYIGVDIFFALSGFLITSILIGEHHSTGRLSLSNFYIKRLLRLYPALLLFLAVYVVVAPLFWPSGQHMRDALFAGLYLSDYTYAFSKTPRYLGHTWSLAVEEQFYLTWPLILALALPRYPLELMRRGLVWGIALAFAWRFHCAEMYPGSAYFRFDTRLPGLLAGCWLATCFAIRPEVARGLRVRWLAWGGLGGVLCIAMIPNYTHFAPMLFYSIPAAEVCAVAMLAGASALPLTARPLIWLGKLSYGIYLWHYPMAFFLRKVLPWGVTFPTVLIVSTAAAWISYVTVEAAARRFRDGSTRLARPMALQAQ